MADTTEKTTEQMEEEITTALVVMEKEGSLTVIEQSKGLVVSDITTKERSMKIQREAKSQKKRYSNLIEPFKKALKARHTNACAKEKELVGPFDEVINAESNKVATYNQAETQRLKKEAAIRAQNEARERGERLEAIKLSIYEATAQATDTEENLEILNLMLEEEGITDEKAEILRSQITVQQSILEGVNRQAAEEAAEAELAAAAPPPPPAASIAPKSKGEVQGWSYKVTVTNMMELCKAIGEGKVPETAVKEAQGKLNGFAKDKIELPGCHISKEPTSHTRG